MLSNIIFNLRMKWIKQQGERYKREQKIKKAYAEYWPEKKEKKTSNIVLAVSIFTIIVYTIASFWITYVRGVTMDSTLTTCVYSFFGGELLVLGGIKGVKVVTGRYSNNECSVTQDNDNTVG